MGLTLHYSARLKESERLPELAAEVEDICLSLDWRYHDLDMTVEVPAAAMPLEPGDSDPKPVRLRGIFFTPPECETAFLTFTPSGRTSTPLQLNIAEDLCNVAPEMVYSIHVKTQYAGLDMHVALVTLLKYLEHKYFHPMEVLDEGNFWDTLDKDVLRAHFDDYWSLINIVKGALENEQWQLSDSPLKLTERIEQAIRRSLGKEGE